MITLSIDREPSRRWLTSVIAIICVLYVTGARAQTTAKLRVAVLDFEAKSGLTKDEASSLSDNFEAELVQSGEFTVVNRSNLKAVLAEQGFQQSEACVASECIVEVGKIIKAQRMFAGSVGTLGKQFAVVIRMIDVQTAATTISKTRNFSGDKEELPGVIHELAMEIIFEITGNEKYKVVSSSSWLWYLGGAALAGGGAAIFFLAPKKAEPTQTEESLPKPPGPPN